MCFVYNVGFFVVLHIIAYYRPIGPTNVASDYYKSQYQSLDKVSEMDYNLGYNDDQRDTIDGKLALFDRYFSDAIEVAPSKLSIRASKPANLWDLPYTTNQQGYNSRAGISASYPAAAFSPGLSEGLTEIYDTEDFGDEPLWSPPLISPALTDATFIDEDCREKNTLWKEPTQTVSLPVRQGPPTSSLRSQGLVGLPASPRPTQRPAFVPSKSSHSGGFLSTHPQSQAFPQARRGSAPNQSSGTDHRINAWLSSANEACGPRQAPLSHHSRPNHPLPVPHVSNPTGASNAQTREPLDRLSSKVPQIRLEGDHSPLAYTPYSSSSASSNIKLPDFVISHHTSRFDPPPAPRLPTFPIELPPSPRVAGPSPIDTSLSCDEADEDTPKADQSSSGVTNTSTVPITRRGSASETAHNIAATEVTYKITQIKPSYPDFALTTPLESEFDFPPPTPMCFEPQTDRPSMKRFNSDQQHTKDSRGSKSLFKRISPTFGRFSRSQGDPRDAMKRRHSEPDNHLHNEPPRDRSRADRKDSTNRLQVASSSDYRKSDKLSGLHSYFRSGVSKPRGVSLGGLETDLGAMNISSPMGSTHGAPLSAVPESASSTNSEKFWW